MIWGCFSVKGMGKISVIYGKKICPKILTDLARKFDVFC